MPEDRLFISVPEMCRRFGISKPTGYSLARRADFPSLTVGNRVLVYEAGLEAWIKKQIEQQKGAAS